MSDDISSLTLSAKRLNARVAWGVERYKERLRRNVRAAFQDGFVVGTELPKTKRDQLALLSARIPYVMSVMLDETQPEPLRTQAAREYQKWQKLVRSTYSERPQKG